MTSTKNLTDAELVSSFTLGNNRAFTILIDRNRDRVLKAIYQVTKDKYISDDIFQDVCIKVFEAIKNGNYQESGKFLPFILRIAHNHTLDCLRRNKQKSFVKTIDDWESLGNINISSPAADHKIVQRETRQLLETMIDRLPGKQRDVVILRSYREISFRKIAQLQQCNINTALGRMRYGLQGLRKATAAALV